nr:pyridoxamine 5'-phosphate oxidase family protein [Rhodococcus kyotonensis]
MVAVVIDPARIQQVERQRLSCRRAGRARSCWGGSDLRFLLARKQESDVTVYHRGEILAQERAGVRAQAERVASVIRHEIPPVVVDFLAEQPMLVVSAVDQAGAVWATLLAGLPGFISATTPTTVDVAATPGPDDPLHDVLDSSTRVGLLALEPGARRRVRMSGTSHPMPDGLRIDLDEIYPNCPKYIQKREPTWREGGPGKPQSSSELSVADQEFVRSADTFFVASADRDGNADVSHRGGNPGFLRMISPTHMQWPDYAGNSMFNTLGNFEINPRAGIVLPQWMTGTLLHLTGTASVDWDHEHAAAVPGAERLVDFDVERVIRIPDATALRWSEAELSRFNPAVRERGSA